LFRRPAAAATDHRATDGARRGSRAPRRGGIISCPIDDAFTRPLKPGAICEDLMANIYDFSVKDIHGKEQKLDQYKNSVMLIVNVASKCGFTPQYKGLEELYERLHPRGLEVLGFPCNQFGAQEPGTEKEIESFCELNYGVTFPLFAKIDVNGDEAAPLYKYLKKAKPGLLGTGAIKWNFTKFLVDRKGNVVERYGSNVEPQAIAADIEKLL
jgi:glutathione peroxidase